MSLPSQPVGNHQSNHSINFIKNPLHLKDIAIIGVMAAILVAVKEPLSMIINVELVSFFFIIFAKHYKERVYYVALVFVLIECFLYGLSDWVIMYLYVWPILITLVLIFQKEKSVFVYALISGLFGLFFGTLCTITTLFVGGPKYALSYFISGLPFDVIHCFANFIICLLLYHPFNKVMQKIKF